MSEYVGFDVSKEETAFCVKDKDGKVLARGKVATDPQALFEVLKEHCLCPERVVMETGTLCHWLARELGKLGMPVVLIDARQAHAVMKLQHNKTDANDADLLAEIGAHRVLPPGGGEERHGAGGSDTLEGALPPGGSAPRY